MVVLFVARLHDEVDPDDAASPSPAKQKNKKRCAKCSAKLELAQRAIGLCRCGKIFHVSKKKFCRHFVDISLHSNSFIVRGSPSLLVAKDTTFSVVAYVKNQG